MGNKLYPTLLHGQRFLRYDQSKESMNQASLPENNQSTPHDPLYKDFFSYPEAVQSLLEDFSPDVAAMLDFSTLEPYPTEHVLEGLRQVRNDAIWKVNRKDGSPCYVVIMLEFQSTVDHWMALRVLGYKYAIWNGLIERKEFSPKAKLPPIFSMVIYNGKTVWNAAQDIFDLIEPAGVLDAFQPHLRYCLLDECQQAENSLPVDGGLATALVRLERSANEQDFVTRFAALWHLLRDTKYKGLRTNILVWTIARFKPDISKSFVEQIANNEEGQAMLAENIQTWRENIWTDGRNEGLLSVVLNMLKEKFSFDQISRATGFSVPEVERLAAEHKHNQN